MPDVGQRCIGRSFYAIINALEAVPYVDNWQQMPARPLWRVRWYGLGSGVRRGRHANAQAVWPAQCL